MTILIDATTAQHARGGIGVVIDGFLGALGERPDAADISVLTGPRTAAGGLSSWSPPLVACAPARIVFQRLALPAVVNLGSRWFGQPDRLLLLDSYVPQWRWPGSSIRVETFVHDVLPLSHPQYFGRRRDIAKRLAFDGIRRQRPKTFTSCAFTASEVKRELGVTPVVAGFGCGQFTDQEADRLLTAAPLARRDYILYVGGIEPRKDLATLVSGFLAAGIEGLRLAFVGNMETSEARAFRTQAKRVAGDRVRFLGRRSNVETFHLMRHARAMVYPSLAEGFGLPVLEGMAASVPVITTNIPAISGWALDGPLYFDPGDSRSLADALGRAVAAEPEPHVARGREISERYRWSRFADTILDS